MATRARNRRAMAQDEPPPPHAMAGRWRDPDDIMPSARRTPREITGWRAFCPLRRMAGNAASEITAQHIMAADKLREIVDVATMGYSSERPLIFVTQVPLPRFGMGAAALAQVKAARALTRVLRVFPASQIAMLETIILRNVSLRVWTVARGGNPAVEKGRLLSILDRLVQHFESDIEDELARGRRLPP